MPAAATRRTAATPAAILAIGVTGATAPTDVSAHTRIKYNADTQYRITNTWTRRTVRPGRYVCIGRRSSYSNKRAAYYAIKTRRGRIIRNDFEYGRYARIYFRIGWQDRGKILETTCAHLIKQHRHR